MTELKKIPYGLTDYKRIRQENYYYVDKTGFIPELERVNFTMFLRPRRFGKSLLVNMLSAYYDVREADNFSALFGDLAIGKNPTAEHNKYLILKFLFSGVNTEGERVQESFCKSALASIGVFVDRYRDYLPGDIDSILAQHSGDLEGTLLELSSVLRRQNLRVYILIDEYDNFTNTLLAESETVYNNVTHGAGFVRQFYAQLKNMTTDNDASVARIFITGVTPMTLSDVTSGFNIAENRSVNHQLNALVGFTESEVRDMLVYYQGFSGVFRHSIDELIAEIRPWYNNNCFAFEVVDEAVDGTYERMYNSDMTLYFINNYLRDGRMPRRMVDDNVTTDYGKMRLLVRYETSFGQKSSWMQRIMNEGGTGDFVPELKTTFNLSDLDDSNNLPSLLFYTGLLTFGLGSDGYPAFIIPNRVVMQQYYNYLQKCYAAQLGLEVSNAEKQDAWREFLRKGDPMPIFSLIAQRLRDVSSLRNFGPEGEAYIKGFIHSTLFGLSAVCITSERELGLGYADLVLEPTDPRHKTLLLIELKYCKSTATEKDVKKQVDDASAQLVQYASDAALLAKVRANGWKIQTLGLVWRGWDLVATFQTPMKPAGKA